MIRAIESFKTNYTNINFSSRRDQWVGYSAPTHVVGVAVTTAKQAVKGNRGAKPTWRELLDNLGKNMTEKQKQTGEMIEDADKVVVPEL